MKTQGSEMMKAAAEMVRRTRMVEEHHDHCPHCDVEFREKFYPRPKLPEGDDKKRREVFLSGDYDDHCPACGGIVDSPELTDAEIEASTFGKEHMYKHREVKRNRRLEREKSASDKSRQFYMPENRTEQEEAKTGNSGKLCTGGNDWENGSTFVWFDSTDDRGETSRVWYRTKVPTGMSDNSSEGTEEEGKKFAEHSKRGWQTWVRTALECMRDRKKEHDIAPGNYSRHDYLRGYKDALTHDDMKPYVEYHGEQRSEFKEKSVATKTVNDILFKQARTDRGNPKVVKEILSARSATDTKASPAQYAAGNYAKGRVNFKGLHIAIENPKGSNRSGVDETGKKWTQTMTADYGYFTRGSMSRAPVAVDGDEIDVFIGPDLDSDMVVAIDQYFGGNYDETKFVIGVSDQKAGEDLYLSNYESGWKLGPVSTCTVNQLKDWLKNGNHKKPFKGQQIKAASVFEASLRCLFGWGSI